MDTGLRGFCLCLFGGDVTDRGVPPLPIVVAFDIDEQVAPRGIAIRVLVLMNELGFQSTEEALHRRIVPAISLAAHRWDDCGGLQRAAVIGPTAGMVSNRLKSSAQRLGCVEMGGDGLPQAALPYRR